MLQTRLRRIEDKISGLGGNIATHVLDEKDGRWFDSMTGLEYKPVKGKTNVLLKNEYLSTNENDLFVKIVAEKIET